MASKGNIKAVEKTEAPTPEDDGAPLTIAKPSGEFDLGQVQVEASSGDRQCRDAADVAPRSQHDGREGLRAPAPRRGDLLVGRAVLRERADQGPEAQHAAPDRRRPGAAVSREQRNPALPPRARDQARRRVLSLPGSHAEPRQQLEQLEPGGMRAGQDAVDESDQPERTKASKATRSASPATRTPSPSPNWPTQSLGELIGRAFAGRMIETEDHPALLRKIGAKQSLS